MATAEAVVVGYIMKSMTNNAKKAYVQCRKKGNGVEYCIKLAAKCSVSPFPEFCVDTGKLF